MAYNFWLFGIKVAGQCTLKIREFSWILQDKVQDKNGCLCARLDLVHYSSTMSWNALNGCKTSWKS